MISRARRMLEGLRSAAKSERVAMASGTPGAPYSTWPGPASGPAWHRAARRGAARAAPDAPRREDTAGARSAAADVMAAAASISRSERNRRRGSVTPVFHQAADRDAREILSLGARGGTRVGRRGRDGEVSALSVTSARAAWTVVSRGRAVASVTTRRLDALPARERGNVPVSSRCRAGLAGTRSAPLTRSPRGSDSNSAAKLFPVLNKCKFRDFENLEAVEGTR